MTDLMIGKTNATKLLRETYKKIASRKGWLSLVQIPAESHMQANAEALKILINEMKYTCIYITLGKPYEELNKAFKSSGVDVERLYFIDAISQMYGIKKVETKKCVYASGPLDIESISASLRELLASMGSEKKCVFLDSITTVLLYNSLPRTLRFSQYLTQTLKKLEVDGVMVSIAKGETTAKLLKELIKVCDEAIEIFGGGALKI